VAAVRRRAARRRDHPGLERERPARGPRRLRARGATFTIVPGRLTVLSGPSGCGKATLLSALLGFTEPATGTITPRPGHGPASAREVPVSVREADPLIQNGSVVPVNPSSTALAAGWLPQDPTLFAGTVADNIRLGWPDAPDEAAAAAARAAPAAWQPA